MFNNYQQTPYYQPGIPAQGYRQFPQPGAQPYPGQPFPMQAQMGAPQMSVPMSRPSKQQSRDSSGYNTQTSRNAGGTTARPERSSTTSKPPLRSIMKKGPARSNSLSAVPLQRVRTTSDPRQADLTRQRSNGSIDAVITDHVFVAFIGTSELRITNLSQADVQHLRTEVLHGVEHESASGTVWAIHFRGQPWAHKGDESIRVMRMICQLFKHLSILGYGFLVSMHTGSEVGARLIFATVEHEKVHFFVAFMGNSGTRFTMVEPPDEIGRLLGGRLRRIWPKRIASGGDSSNQDVVNVELKAGFSIRRRKISS